MALLSSQPWTREVALPAPRRRCCSLGGARWLRRASTLCCHCCSPGLRNLHWLVYRAPQRIPPPPVRLLRCSSPWGHLPALFAPSLPLACFRAPILSLASRTSAVPSPPPSSICPLSPAPHTASLPRLRRRWQASGSEALNLQWQPPHLTCTDTGRGGVCAGNVRQSVRPAVEETET